MNQTRMSLNAVDTLTGQAFTLKEGGYSDRIKP